MSRRSVDLLIEDLWEAVEKVERYTAGFDHDRFVKDEKTIDSVVRNFEKQNLRLIRKAWS